jgi:1-acyl-sn-glycerol-3-phosphate acyltransferase
MSKIFHNVSWFFSFLLVHIFFRPKIEGNRKLPEGGHVIVPNHISYADWILMYYTFGGPISFVMWHGFYFKPFSWFWDLYKCIPISGYRENPKVVIRAFKKIHTVLVSGGKVLIFPEGGITDDGQLMKFKPGIERILEQDNVPIIPVYIDGLWGGWFSKKNGMPGSKWPTFIRREVTITIGGPSRIKTAQQAQDLVANLA